MVAELRECIRRNLDCADVCAATGKVLARPTSDTALIRALVEVCRDASVRCAEECEKHAEMHEHCRVCAKACRRCEQACSALLAAL